MIADRILSRGRINFICSFIPYGGENPVILWYNLSSIFFFGEEVKKASAYDYFNVYCNTDATNVDRY